VVGAVGVVAILLAAFSLMNLVYHVARKPTELFFLVDGGLDKKPGETWQQYGPSFRAYSTSTITPELLAALAQVESTGNPVARTYWRWQLNWNPLAVYQPASSAVGLYQMTDAAYAEAARSCIRENAVVDADCGFTSLYIRALPSHAIELAAVYLDRNVAAVLARAPDATANPQQKQDLAAFIHLCGAGPAGAFVRRGFQMMAGERCGDHLVAAYLARVNAMSASSLALLPRAGIRAIQLRRHRTPTREGSRAVCVLTRCWLADSGMKWKLTSISLKPINRSPNNRRKKARR
jgi:Transglycosylase SLT domain